MATPTIPNGEEYFFPIIYEGNGAGQRVGKFVPFTDNGTIDNSCIFNDGDSAQLERTPSSNGNRRTFTVSAWVKRGVLGTEQHICSSYDGSSTDNNSMWEFRFLAANTISISVYTTNILITNRTFEDTSKFYHVLMAVDTTQGTASDRVKLYVDGDEITSFSTDNRSSTVTQNFDTAFNNTADACVVGNRKSQSKYFDGYMAEVNLVDGTALTPSTFGVTDTSTGRWIPKTLSGITYGTNGFRLKFQDSSALGDDSSGNGNDLTATNLASTDQTTDSPTQNHATLQGTGGTLSEGNLKLVTGTSDFSHHNATLKPKSGKYYAEFTCDSMGRSEVGIASTTKLPYSANNVRLPATTDGSLAGIMWYGYNGNYIFNSSNTEIVSGTSYTTNDVIGIALDLDNLNVKFYKNNTLDETFSIPNSNYTFVAGDGATGYSGGWTANFGQKSFNYTPPTGFVALQQDNLPTTDKGVSGLTWTKNRDGTDWHYLVDSSRGNTKALNPNDTAAEETHQDGVQKFLKGGISIEDRDNVNKSGNSFVNWTWVANGGTTETNNDGNTTVTLQKNTTAGFSIGTFTSTVASQTLGHGLGVAPELIILKCRSTTQNWLVYHKQLDLTDAHYLHLNASDAEQTGSDFGNTLPTSTVFTANPTGVEGRTYCFWAWNSVEGYSKFGKYVGNGNTDGTFVYTGFRPAFVLMKRFNSTGNWYLKDTTRDTFNPCEKTLMPNLSNAEAAQTYIDILSNGFKQRIGNDASNLSGSTYVYIAFAEHPFVGDGTSPVTAR